MTETLKIIAEVGSERLSLLQQTGETLREAIRLLELLELEVAAAHVQWALDLVN